ncbi:3-deoxy-7-phosphoheptulonate synthase [Amycolatopsis sp. PS_44_ISF1]|uniref:3-deoxy-7-phosphoheptulonate synthase n=1 Tax=Amycolatopsis sp. PS_44_ISF1 TaxID=2974917 RepID=UPI0028DDFFB8|nr:3-deoxy-7-phosphoheptulonate synthase [Amycolatopsis sp. PS_44_ISF1]MDT8915986.1 3-deoxy-7-phosphoheptulonate synthase [Amycolatopsis sp. PS_44_ISF1]
MIPQAVLEITAAHQPDWPVPAELAAVRRELRARPPLVDAHSCHALAGELEFVARGEAVVIQAGDCAELFADSARHRVQAKASQVHQLCEIVESAGIPAVRIGRFAGQFAKPRSCATEILADGSEIPVYRGDAVNGLAPTAAARRPDPARLLTAYDFTARGLDALFMRQLLLSEGSSGIGSMLAPTYISHEALLLDFEHGLLRPDPARGGAYASSAHLVWIGERTRQLDHAHLAFAERITNPVGVKIGPGATPEELIAIVDRLAAGRGRGGLILIIRMGAQKIADRLPTLVAALGSRAGQVSWLCDPMHGNTRKTSTGRKTRVVTEIQAEIEQFCRILRERRLHPGGLHLETSPDPVTECLDTMAGLTGSREPDRYESACDPRLNPVQAEQVVRHFTRLL